MSDLAGIENTTDFADAYYSGVQIVAEYMHQKSDAIEAVLCKNETGNRDAAMKGLWFRCRAWMQSLERLNHTKHFQAISAANRALLEITVDLVLLHHDKTNAFGWKIHQWGISERMKAAEQVVFFYKKKSIAIPEEYEPLHRFYQNDKGLVDLTRLKLWPNKSNPTKAEHPRRWTGSSDLFADIHKADLLYGPEIRDQLGVGLVEYYRTQYRQMNWQIHSGVAGFWKIPPEGFDIGVGLALKACADFALLSTKIVLTDFGFREVLPDLSGQWDRLREERVRAYAEKMNLKP